MEVGFANNEALSQGQTGIACRGEEHDVTMVWSLTSGKRQITMDGQEVHYASSRAGLSTFLDYARQSHPQGRCPCQSPLSATPSFRHDFFVDGQSFFDMPKVYEAIQESLAESRRHLQHVKRSDDSYSASGTSAGPDYLAHAPSPQEPAPSNGLVGFGSPTSQEPTALVPVAPQYAAPAPAYGQPPAPAYGYSPAPPPALTYEPAPVYAPAAPAYTQAPVYAAPSTHTPLLLLTVPAAFKWSTAFSRCDFTASAPPSYGFPVQQPMYSEDDPFAPKPPTQNELLTSVLGLYEINQLP
ncbi:hypothetical protein MHU86_1983 [Fragilaria crotonensis]|nr:hypothetical protein MHU86_1983 [Fragilaria crotonensis]